MKTFYYLGHLGYNKETDSNDIMKYIMDNPEGRKGICEYWYTYNIYEAKKFESKVDVFNYLLQNPQQFDKIILLEYTDEYLNKIKDNATALWHINHPTCIGSSSFEHFEK